MNIPLNRVVECPDGLCGRLTHILVSPTVHQVSHIVVKLNQPPYPELVVPEQFVLEVLHNLIRLRCNQTELKMLDAFIETNYDQVKVKGLKDVAYIKRRVSILQQSLERPKQPHQGY